MPILGFIGKILKYYLGKTSIWGILVLSRKAFITINAMLGVFFILKLTGLDITMILSNYSILGNTYLEIIQKIIKNTFNWIFDLLDLKIVPQDKPTSSWYNPTSWWGKEEIKAVSELKSQGEQLKVINDKTLEAIKDSVDLPSKTSWKDLTLRDTYKAAIHNAHLKEVAVSSVYKDPWTYAYILGGIGITAFIGASGLLLYSYISTVGWFNPLSSVNLPPYGTTGAAEATNVFVEAVNNTQSIPQMVGSVIASGYGGSVAVVYAVASAVNPYTWLSIFSKGKRILDRDQRDAQTQLLANQKVNGTNNRVHLDTTEWPFTNVNPHEPLIYRIKHLLYETQDERKARYDALKDIFSFWGDDVNSPATIRLLEKYSGWVDSNNLVTTDPQPLDEKLGRASAPPSPPMEPVAGPSIPREMPIGVTADVDAWSEGGSDDDMSVTIKPPITQSGVPSPITKADLETTPKGNDTNPLTSFGVRRKIVDKLRGKKPLASLESRLEDAKATPDFDNDGIPDIDL